MSWSQISTTQARQALDFTVAVTCALSLLTVTLLAQRPPATRAAPSAVAPAPRVWRPWVAFLCVCALLLLNQLVVNAYIVRLYDGDATFVRRYLGHGWFVLAPDAPPVRWLVEALPERWLRGPLAYCILRVQAVLELPFALLAYLSVVAMLDATLYRWLVRSVLFPLAAISFTFTFCLIELRLYNPWTQSDLYARWLAAAALLGWWGRRRLTDRDGPTALQAPRLGLGGLLVFFVGAAAAGAVVLVLYDAALVYNLGHLHSHLPVLVVGVLLGSLAAIVRTRAARVDSGEPGPGLQGLTATLGTFAVGFFAPSLSIRYCGARLSALLGASLLLLGALLLGLMLAARALGRRGIPTWRALLGLGVALITAQLLLRSNLAGWLRGGTRQLFELTLLQNAALIFPTAALAVWLLDRLLGDLGTQRRIRG